MSMCVCVSMFAVCRVTKQPGSVQAGHRQEDEERIAPTADGRRRELSSSASRYLKTNSGLCLPTGQINRAQHKVSLLTHKGVGYEYSIKARCNAGKYQQDRR